MHSRQLGQSIVPSCAWRVRALPLLSWPSLSCSHLTKARSHQFTHIPVNEGVLGYASFVGLTVSRTPPSAVQPRADVARVACAGPRRSRLTPKP